MTQEQQEKELIQAREDCVRLREETHARESLYQDQLAALQSNREVLEHQLKIVEERARELEEDLRRASPSSGQPPKPIGMTEIPTVTSTTVDDTFTAKPGDVNYEVSTVNVSLVLVCRFTMLCHPRGPTLCYCFFPVQQQ